MHGICRKGCALSPAPPTLTISKENISIFGFESTSSEMAQIRAQGKGEVVRYFNISYKRMGAFFTRPLY